MYRLKNKLYVGNSYLESLGRSDHPASLKSRFEFYRTRTAPMDSSQDLGGYARTVGFYLKDLRYLFFYLWLVPLVRLIITFCYSVIRKTTLR